MMSRERPSVASAGPDRRPARALAMVWVLALLAFGALAVWLQVLGPLPVRQPTPQAAAPTAGPPAR